MVCKCGWVVTYTRLLPLYTGTEQRLDFIYRVCRLPRAAVTSLLAHR